ncbi:peptidoglycan endopeptidase [Flavobacterium sufflavum]|uniref:Peptidoglycan endopeptidase n=1 Tax=Flavobacterium sufflavum TaxID=1921138 RepID=A0A437KYH5_9FLAO|nr:peptidoglycan endopeptidase [Flavobacterium sufflavum]RVT77650.1 peptidoglycan endopeptidase [Flavobacterium sufflavum]
MRCKFWILLLVLFSAFNGFSQEKFIQHSVAKGETISKIAEQYHVKPAAIYEINPDAKKGIKFKEILLVPVGSSTDKKSVVDASKSNVAQKEHLVLAKETLYGIAKQYGVKVADLYSLNPLLEKRGLRVGNSINVPDVESKDLVVENTPKKEVSKTEIKIEEPKKEVVQLNSVKKDTLAVVDNSFKGNILKEVLAKETLYGIAKEYGVSVVDIEKANPILEKQSLRIGQKIVIPTTNKQLFETNSDVAIIKKEEVKLEPKNETAVVVERETKVVNDFQVELSHEVLAKETKYGIAKQYGLTVKELEAQNPKIVNKLLVGEKLTIRTSKSNVKTATKYDFSDDTLVDDGVGVNYNMKSFQGTDLIDQLISTASENIGVRYRTGGTTKDGFDCSGLMCTTFGAFDIQLPRTSFEQSQFGMKIDAENAQKGDLIFFKTNGRSQINHVGMVVEVCDGDIKFIHASVGGGVIISSIKEKYYSKRVTQINRVL